MIQETEQSGLEAQIWWVADFNVPYLVKSFCQKDCLLLKITNLKSVYSCRVDQTDLVKGKQTFCPNLQISTTSDLLELFKELLSDFDASASYKFSHRDSSHLTFQYNIVLRIYKFSWTFELRAFTNDIGNMLCRQIINPLGFALQMSNRRIAMLERRLETAEKQLPKKVLDSLGVYKSDPGSWKQVHPERFDKRPLNQIPRIARSLFDMQAYLGKPQEPSLGIKNISENVAKLLPRKGEPFKFTDKLTFDEDLLNSTAKPKGNKRVKVIDFI